MQARRGYDGADIPARTRVTTKAVVHGGANRHLFYDSDEAFAEAVNAWRTAPRE